ncbi:MAG: chloride channel protein, partial [Oscillospiraceae bacterium]|nr:chloride channel protein [Oscillospiraceae bacterium]
MKLLLNNLHHYLRLWGLYCKGLGKWLLVSGITGLLCGVLGSAFHVGVEESTVFRMAHPWVLYTLPAAGLLVVAIYKFTRAEGQSTNNIIDEVQSC